MRKIFVLILTATVVAACGGGGGGPSNPTQQPDACGVAGQKQFVLDAMYDWYLWNDLLPDKNSVNIDEYSTPDALLDFLTSFQPLDSFSFINTAQADQQFFGEGQFEGFRFQQSLSRRRRSASDPRVRQRPCGQCRFRARRSFSVAGRAHRWTIFRQTRGCPHT